MDSTLNGYSLFEILIIQDIREVIIENSKKFRGNYRNEVCEIVCTNSLKLLNRI